MARLERIEGQCENCRALPRGECRECRAFLRNEAQYYPDSVDLLELRHHYFWVQDSTNTGERPAEIHAYWIAHFLSQRKQRKCRCGKYTAEFTKKKFGMCRACIDRKPNSNNKRSKKYGGKLKSATIRARAEKRRCTTHAGARAVVEGLKHRYYRL